MAIRKQERWTIYFVFAAFASPALYFFGVYLSNISVNISKTRLAWASNVLATVSEVFFLPGAKVCEWLGGMKGSIPDLGLILICEFVCNWALLFTCMAMIELLLTRKSRQA